MIFTFKITNQTDSQKKKLQTKHNFQIYDFHFSLSEIINSNTNTNTNSHGWGKLNPEKKKMENERPCHACGHGRGRGDERGRGLCDSVRSATARMKRSWESRELGTGDTDRAWTGGKRVGRSRTVGVRVRIEGGRRGFWLLSWWWRNGRLDLGLDDRCIYIGGVFL